MARSLARDFFRSFLIKAVAARVRVDEALVRRGF